MMKRLLPGLVLLALLVAVGNAFAAERKPEMVIKILKLSVEPVADSPEKMKVTALGEMNSAAKNPELRLRQFRDGVAEYDFVAKMPDGPTTMMMGEIKVEQVLARPPGLQEVRVHAKSNALTERVR